MNLDGVCAAGATIRRRITHPGYEHVTVEMLIERRQIKNLARYVS